MVRVSPSDDVAASPPHHIATPLMYQDWKDVGFVHWRYDVGAVQRLVPDGLRVEEFDGSAWVSLTPFRIEGAHPPMMPGIPGLRTYNETNLRTYVIGPDGRRGVWFMALDSVSLAAFILGRTAYMQPYMWSSLSTDGTATRRRYWGRRILPSGGVSYDLTLNVGPAIAAQSELDVFLTGRWLMFTFFGPLPAAATVEHEPWPLRSAEVRTITQDVLEGAGLSAPEQPPIAHYAAGVSAKLSSPRLIKRTA